MRGVSSNSIQGDRAINAALMLFGAKGQRNARTATIRPDRLRGIKLDAHDIPDLVPVLSAVAACAEGTTRSPAAPAWYSKSPIASSPR